MDPLLTAARRPLLWAALLLASAAHADLFSPGELSRAHAHLEGLGNCTQCHPAGGKLSPDNCLACHTELKPQLSRKQGFHGRLTSADLQTCESCHHEHQGRDAPLIEWEPSRPQFAHARTGWPLTGKHGQVKCDDCHQPRRIADPQVRALLEKTPKRTTYLGLPTRCASCHFDEHRGQLGADCERCHETKGWAPAPGFDHAKTDFVLTGKHRQVACAKCHEPQPDGKTPADAFPAPRARTFVAFGDVAHGSCLDCHADPHDGRFGADCASCHTTAGWMTVRAGGSDRAFHDKTRYPLKGRHAPVACKSCHGPFPGQKARFKGLPFAACTDCHLDAHVGQLTANGGKRVRPCEDCHTVEGFIPARFAPAEHVRTRYPLEGAHQAVACTACHQDDVSLQSRIPAAVVKRLKRQGRTMLFSKTRFDAAKPPDRCDSCHADPHKGQFTRGANARTCAQCHDVKSFHDVAGFDHTRDTTFTLTGKHATAGCASCHGSGASTRYRGTPTACAECHVDVHARQFAQANGRTDCARCHETTAFKPARFVHAPPQTAFVLEGKHQAVPCERCHFEVTAGGMKVRRYRPLPSTCEGCHEDFHKGAFARFLPGSVAPAAAKKPRKGNGAITPCAGCHTVEGFRPARFDHERSGFPLRGRHAQVTCRACHTRDLETPLPRDCAGCHRDPHRGELGARCEGCHAEDRGWRSAFDAEAHRRTNFPLIGRHGALPCSECHVTAADRRFSGTPVECVACHQRDYDRTAGTGVDHRALGFPTECRQCHDGWMFRGAQLLAHEACFSLRGEHAGISCTECHSSLPQITGFGACASMTAACTSCHEHSCAETDDHHREVPGYQCKDRKCYECHRFSGAR